MPTIAAPTSLPRAERVHSPIVYVAEHWGDDWVFRPDLELSRATATTAAHDMPTLEIRRWFGEGKAPHGVVGKYTRTPIDLPGYWVRMKLVGEQGMLTEWMGRIETESRDVHAKEDPHSGVQYWTAYGPGQILRKIVVSKSVWYRDGQEQTLGWVPDVNGRDSQCLMYGNRTYNKHSGTYLYGPVYPSTLGVWSHYDYLEYVLKRFVQATGGPQWHIGGHSADALKDIKMVVRMGFTQSVWDIIRRLISTRLGFDYRIAATDDGFEVRVFALTADDWSVGGMTLPKNPVAFNLKVSDEKHLTNTKIVKSREHRYGKISVEGRRIVVCCSLKGAEAVAAGETTTLVGKWTSAQETAYLAGTGTLADDKQEHDQARTNDKYRPVFQFFGAPSDWDWNEGLARVELDAHGNVIPMSTGDYQNVVRRTLGTLPLHENVDYSTNPPTESIPTGHEADFRSPEVWVYDTGIQADAAAPRAPGWVSAEVAEIGVSAPGADWGVILSASPNHLLALNHWEGAEDTAREPGYDHEKMVCTIALETDQRFALTYEMPDAKPEDGVLVVPVPDAELWYLAPDTVVGVAENGTLKHSPSEGYTLRNDAEYMALVLAGALSRYHDERAKAEITFAGLQPFSHWLGQILRVIEVGGDTHAIGAPITSVEWNVPTGPEEKPTTIVRTGFAR